MALATDRITIGFGGEQIVAWTTWSLVSGHRNFGVPLFGDIGSLYQDRKQ